MEKMDRETLAHEVQSKQDMEQLGLTMKDWGKYTYEYLYIEPEITVNLLE